MAAQGGDGYGRGRGGRDNSFNPGFHPEFNPGRGGRGRGYGTHRGRGRYGAYNQYGGTSNYGGGHSFTGGRGFGTRGRWNQNPHRQYQQGPELGAPQFIPHQALAQQHQPQHAFGASTPQMQQATLQQHGTPLEGAQQGATSTTPPPNAQVLPGAGTVQGGGAPAASSGVDTTSARIQQGPKVMDPHTIDPKGMQIDIPESTDKIVQKPKNKTPFCYRCRSKGHTIHECTVGLCCEICYGEHVIKLCQNAKKMNANAVLYGYAVEGLGFYYILVNETPKIHTEEKSAVVRVLDGSFTAEQLAVELEKLLPYKKHNWEIEAKGTDAFLINFPSAELLDTVVNWGAMDAKVNKGKIRFEKGAENEVRKYEIDKVWIQFRGLPSEFREFPIIWAIGTILGVPRAVDMVFTKNTGRPRFRAAVLDPKLIPQVVDVVIGDFVYELQFWVEEDSLTGEPQLIDMDAAKEDDPKGEEPENDNNDKTMEVDEENQPHDDASQPQGQGYVPPTAGQKKANIGATVLAENAAISSSQISSAKNTKKPVVVLSQTANSVQSDGAWKANLMPSQVDSGIVGNNAASGIVSPVRYSKRSVATSDQDSIEKAAKLKAKKNLDSSADKGTVSRNALALSLGKLAAA